MNTWATHAYDKDGNEIGDPYGVPTGVVPRRYPFDQRDHIREDLTEKLPPATFIYHPPLRRSVVAREAVLGYKSTPEDEVEIKRRQAEMVAAVEFTALGPRPDPIQQAVDDYLLMERKAKAWDELLITARCAESSISGQALAAKMDELLRPLA